MTSKVQERKHETVYLTQQSAKKEGKGKKKKKNRGQGKDGTSKDGLNYHSGVQNRRNGGVTFSMAPTTSGVASMTYRFMPAGLPNKNSTHDYRFGVKIRGAEMMNGSVQSSAATTSLFPGGAYTIPGTCGNLFTTGSRVLQFATIYGFCCVRRLKIHYVPIVATTFPGLFAVGITENPLVAVLNTIQLVSQCESSTLNNAWLPKTVMEYTNDGNRDYSTLPIATDTNEPLQFAIFGAQSGMTVSTQVGYLFAEYEIDFYSPQSAQTSLAAVNPVAPSATKDRSNMSNDSSTCSLSNASPSKRASESSDEEKGDDRELVVVRQTSTRSSSLPPSSRSVETDRGGSGWFAKTPTALGPLVR
jgi:hypothetical protein